MVKENYFFKTKPLSGVTWKFTGWLHVPWDYFPLDWLNSVYTVESGQQVHDPAHDILATIEACHPA